MTQAQVAGSTPSEALAQWYIELPSLLWRQATYSLANHMPPPSATVAGAIFPVPPEVDANTIFQSLLEYNQSLRTINTKQLNGSTIVQVLFQGTVVPGSTAEHLLRIATPSKQKKRHALPAGTPATAKTYALPHTPRTTAPPAVCQHPSQPAQLHAGD